MQKALYLGRLPIPLLHIDTGWNSQAMIQHRDRIAPDLGPDVIVHINQDGVAQGVYPFDPRSSDYARIMKTVALTQALDAHGFDVALGGARRDEAKSRGSGRS